MRYDEFVSQVQKRAELPDREHAEQAVEAVLSVLGDRLAGGEPGDLAAQLPPEAARFLDATGAGERFSVEEFYERVAEREGRGCTPGQAREHAMAVMSTVVDTVTEGERGDLASQLPEDYGELLR